MLTSFNKYELTQTNDFLDYNVFYVLMFID